eukprot:CAMPEP_0180637798 /NCGR_PEP_ID=MMETSP1037_2-20121125/43889_1 /TAXON_ID=632150 /ORGANISM="Azadinium spinosum, Strain 3D9" /LENGTH=44 /DNA_ID= /DNA_START= /DNA_END= /DNA_ORIENTATION=
MKDPVRGCKSQAVRWNSLDRPNQLAMKEAFLRRQADIVLAACIM